MQSFLSQFVFLSNWVWRFVSRDKYIDILQLDLWYYFLIPSLHRWLNFLWAEFCFRLSVFIFVGYLWKFVGYYFGNEPNILCKSKIAEHFAAYVYPCLFLVAYSREDREELWQHYVPLSDKSLQKRNYLFFRVVIYLLIFYCLYNLSECIHMIFYPVENLLAINKGKNFCSVVFYPIF